MNRLLKNINALLLVLPVMLVVVAPVSFAQQESSNVFLHQYCGTPDDGIPQTPSEPAVTRPMPDGWVDLPEPEESIGALSENIEKTEVGTIRLYSYPKFFKNASGHLEKINTNFQTTSLEEWDYEVTSGIWSLRVKTDGTFQAEHLGESFTYKFQNLGIGVGETYRPVDLGNADFSRYQVNDNTIKWSEVFADVDLTLTYIEDVMKVDVIVKREFMNDLREEVKTGNLEADSFLTARFEIPKVFVNSTVKQDGVIRNLYEEQLNLESKPLSFERDGKVLHQLLPVETYVIDEEGKRIEGSTKIRTAQNWQLKQNGSGYAEMSAKLEDLANSPEGDVVIDPSMNFGYNTGATKDARLQNGSSNKLGGQTSIPMNANDHAVIACDFNDPSYNPLGTDKAVTNVKLHIYVISNSSSSSIALKSYNITTNWSESTVAWDYPWNSNGGDYTTSNAGNASTIPGQTTGWQTIDLTAPFKARYPASITEFLNKGFLLKYSTPPVSSSMSFASKEWSTTGQRWYIEVTYAEVSSVVITNAGTYTPDRLYAPRQRDIKATITPPVSGVTVNFEVMDIDDPADDPAIDTSSGGGDNYGPAGTLSSSSSVTNANGEASVTFSTTSKVGGDNYTVRASVSGTSKDSPEMIVWRKLNIEYDVMSDTPSGTTDWGGTRKHIIHDNYLNGVAFGLKAIFEADYNDGSHKKNRNTYTTPVVIPNEAPPSSNRTTFVEFIPHNTSYRNTYHANEWNSSNLHLMGIHLNSGAPNVDPVGGHADVTNPREFAYLIWDKQQYDSDQDPNIDVDAGTVDNFWILAHEIGHTLDPIKISDSCNNLSHHKCHGEDDVAGLAGHDCIMTQATTSPSLNVNGQNTKRFGPKCVREIRNRVSNTAGIE